MRRALVLTVFSLVLVALPTLAKTPSRKAPPDSCSGSANEESLLGCRQGENARSEKRLGQLFDKLDKGYRKDEPALAPLFDEAQRKWRDYRDAECKVRTYYSSTGSAYEIYRLDCLTRMNAERILLLQQQEASP
jgi:uncharacterized protein YecT (DUF1311 family)